MSLKPCYLLLLCLVCIYFSNAVLNYGPFKARIIKLDHCKGPRQKDCGVIKLINKKLNESAFLTNAIIKKNIDRAKFRLVGSMNGNTVMSLQLDNFCKNLGVEMMIKSLVSVSKNCTVLQGSYSNVFEIDYWASFFFGGKYFYGNFTFKAAVYKENCNYMCSVYGIEYSPRSIT